MKRDCRSRLDRQPLSMGQRLEVPLPGRLIARSESLPERIFPTPVLNHETSDHLLSLVDKIRTVALKISACSTNRM